MSILIQGAAGFAPRFEIAGGAALQSVPGSSLAAWVEYTGGFETQEQVIGNVSNALSQASARANISLRHQSGVFRASARRLDSDSITIVDSIAPITSNVTHVCATFEYNNQAASIYINGVLDNSIFVPSWTGLSSNTPSLGTGIGGRADGNPGSSIEGLIGDAQIFSRALPAAEVANLFFCQGRDNNYYLNGGRLRMNGGFVGEVAFTQTDSVNLLQAVPLGGPPQNTYSNQIAVPRRRRRR